MIIKMYLKNSINSLFFYMVFLGMTCNYSQANNSSDTSNYIISGKVKDINISNIKKRLKHNMPKTYVYVCDVFPARKRLIFIKNNQVIQSIPIEKNRELFSTNINLMLKDIEDYYATRKRLTQKFRGKYGIKNINIYLMEGKVYFIQDFSNSHHNFKFYIEFDKQYGYVSILQLNRPIEGRKTPDLFYGMSMYSYGLLALPKETNYTDKVVEKILDKYNKAWECEDEKPQEESTKNNTNLTKLERIVGREKLKCLENLVWEK